MLQADPSMTLSPPEPLGPNMLSHWHLDPDVAFVNHGCFGACPRVVLDAQTHWREVIERRPIETLGRDGIDGLLAPAKHAVADLIGGAPDDLGFVSNATGGVNAVLQSIEIQPGDELLTTSHVYNAVRMTMKHLADRYDATYIEHHIPLPVQTPAALLESVMSAVTDRTKILVIDHVASPTAILFPIREIIAACAERGVDVLVDGAHAPGMVPVDVESLGAAYYTGNLHKWVCAPKGSAFLWVRKDKQKGIHPNTISHFYDEGLASEFGWQGTRDVTQWIAAKDAIDFLANLGWDRLRAHNHALAMWAQERLCNAWGVEPTAPLDGSMIGAMTTVEAPSIARDRYETFEDFKAAITTRYAIEVPVIEWNERWWIRSSCQVYNTPEEYERLAAAVLELLG